MKFHPDKCTVLRVTNKKKIIDAKYQLHGHTLESVTSAKYLGLTFTNKLQWDQHIHSITSKANKTLGCLRRNLKIPSIRIKEQAYFTLARPLVEYSSTVWDPYTQTDINKVDAVQRRAARYVANNHRNRSSVNNIIQRLKWRPLSDRRKDARLVILYKIDRELAANTGARGTDLPPPFFLMFLFSIKFLYFFIISSLFPYFNLFVSIFIQSYVNIKLHVSTLYRY